ncbi:MAG: hypothetical protein ACOCY6_06090 [Halodesulfurarchaeum sp.]
MDPLPGRHTVFGGPGVDLLVVGQAHRLLTDPVGFVQGLYEWWIYNVSQAFLDVVTLLGNLGLERLLFFPNPDTVPTLQTLWWTSVGAFLAIGALSFLYRLLAAQFFPKTDGSDLQGHLERFTKYAIIIFITPEIVAFGTEAAHLLTAVFFRRGLSLTGGVNSLRELVDSLGLTVGAVYMMVFGPLLWLTVGLLFAILIARLVLVYFIYSMLPLLLSFQVVKVGPWKLVDEFSSDLLKSAGMLLAFGIFVSVMLWISQMSLEGLTTTADSSIDMEAGNQDIVGPIRSYVLFLVPLVILDVTGLKILWDVT